MAAHEPRAVDRRLRRAARVAVGRWVSDTDKALRALWDHTDVLEDALAGAAAGERRAWWAEQLSAYGRRRTRGFYEAADARRAELEEQAYAVLLAMQPRSAESEFAPPELPTIVAGLAPATAAGVELAAMAEEIDADLRDMADRVSALETARADGYDRLTHAFQEVLWDLARVESVGYNASSGPLPYVLRLLVEPELVACNTLRAAVPDPDAVGQEADRALASVMARTWDTAQAAPSLAEQLEALAGPFDAAAAEAGELKAETGVLVTAIYDRMHGYGAHFGSVMESQPLRDLVTFYGRPAALALRCLPGDLVQALAMRLFQHFSLYDCIRRDGPQNPTPGQLVWVFHLVASCEDTTLTGLCASVAAAGDEPGDVPWLDPGELRREPWAL